MKAVHPFRGVLFCIAASIAALAVAPAWAVNPAAIDRDYQFGEDEGGLVGQPAGSNVNGTFFTFDSAGQSMTGNFQDLEVFGNPVYADVSDRPAFGGGVGIALDGDGDALVGANLNLPSTSQASLGYDDDEGATPTNTPGPENYSGISNRFFQLWVKPADPNGGNQSVVMDSNQHGVRIANGNWSLRYDGTDVDSGVAATTDWTHVMVARPFGANGGGRLYVDGVAVAAEPGGYDGGANEQLVVGANTSRDENNFFDGASAEFFNGLIDNLQMAIIGDNSADPGPPAGQDFGTFEFAEDNDFVANVFDFDLLDLNRDGAVSGNGSGPAETDDVTAFVAGWLSVNNVNGVQVGDLNSLQNGDVNFDGRTDLADWSRINAANPAVGASIAAALNLVPEPTSVALLLAAAGSLAVVRRNR